MRRFGAPPESGRSYRRRPGAYGVILRERQMLIAVNPSVGEEIALPGGGIDPGETPVAALHREALEETGWRIAVTARLGAYKRFTYMPEYDMWAEKVCHIYLCRAARPVAPPLEPDHAPVLIDARVAATLLSVDGDRWFAGEALRRAGL